MSRTYKDKPNKLKEAWDKDREYFEYTKCWISVWGDYREHRFTYSLQTKTTKPKKRKEVDTEDHWMTTPMWWIRERMNRPQRHEGRIWESNVLKAVDLEELDKPNVGRKPHIYYW